MLASGVAESKDSNKVKFLFLSSYVYSALGLASFSRLTFSSVWSPAAPVSYSPNLRATQSNSTSFKFPFETDSL